MKYLSLSEGGYNFKNFGRWNRLERRTYHTTVLVVHGGRQSFTRNDSSAENFLTL